jgi:hypothetical protein
MEEDVRQLQKHMFWMAMGLLLGAVVLGFHFIELMYLLSRSG